MPASSNMATAIIRAAKEEAREFRGTFFSIEFRVNPHFDLEPEYIIEREFYAEFNGIPCVRKYCLFFTHESIIDQYVSVSICRHCKVLDEKFAKRQKLCQKQPLPLEARGLPSNT